MTRNFGFTPFGSIVSRALLLLALVFAGACGSGEYDSRLEKRVQQLKAEEASRPAETEDSGADEQATDSSDPDELDEDLEDPPVDEDPPADDPVDPAEEDQLPEDE